MGNTGFGGRSALFARNSYPIDSPDEETQYSFRPYLTEVRERIESNHNTSNVEFTISPKVRDYLKKHQEKSFKNSRQTQEYSSQVSEEHQPSEEEKKRLFEESRLKLDQRIRVKLLRSRYFSINDLYKQAEQKEAFDKEFEEIDYYVQSLPDLSTLSRESFVELCCTDKYQSKALQVSLCRGDSSQKKALLKLCESSIDDLIQNKYGNYILQEAIRQSSKMAAAIEFRSVFNLTNLMKDEYASRVMQVLNSVSQTFRLSVMRWFSVGLESTIDKLSAIFLLTSAIEAMESPEELNLVRGILFSKSSKRLSNCKYFKRIIMSFVDRCSPSDLDFVFTYFSFEKRLLSLLDDKFGALLINSMIKRNHPATIQVFLWMLKNYLPSLYETKFFKFLLFRLVKTESTGDVLQMMLDAVLEISDQLLVNATASTDSYYFFVHLVISLLAPDMHPLLLQLDQHLEDKEKLLSIIRQLRKPISDSN